MLPRSSSLFHFTGNIDVLKAILKEGFWPRYCLEGIQWQGHDASKFVAFPMVCFCDIPIGRISEHVESYGSFGIGLTKEWAARNNLNPVMYFAADNPLHAAIRALTEMAFGLDGDKKEEGLRNVRYILAHSKPTKGLAAGKSIEKEFYQESEWRFVPQHDDILAFLKSHQYQNESLLGEANAKTAQLSKLRFLPSDVRYIFVPTDADIPGVMNFLMDEFAQHSDVDLKVLMSRVTSLKHISGDV